MIDQTVFAILGGGNGGFCTAADLTLRGYETRLFEFPEFAHTLEPVIQKGGINLRGIAGEGFAQPAIVTTDIEAALDGADLVLVIVPSAGHKLAARACAPYLKDDQIIVLIPGNCGGALEFRKELLAHGGSQAVTISETTTLMYAVKKENENGVWARGLKSQLPLAAIPAHRTQMVLDRLHVVYPQFEASPNILDTGFNCLNCIVHPPGMLLNMGYIQGDRQEPWFFYKDGYTEGVSKISAQLDTERLAIVRAFGLQEVTVLESLFQYYRHQGLDGENLYEVFANSPIHHAARGPKTTDQRMLTEDVPYGLVPLTSFARLARIDTPIMDSIINLANVVCQTDFRQSGRTLVDLGLEDMSKDDVMQYVIFGDSEPVK